MLFNVVFGPRQVAAAARVAVAASALRGGPGLGGGGEPVAVRFVDGAYIHHARPNPFDLAVGEYVIECPSPRNALKATYDHSYC